MDVAALLFSNWRMKAPTDFTTPASTSVLPMSRPVEFSSMVTETASVPGPGKSSWAVWLALLRNWRTARYPAPPTMARTITRTKNERTLRQNRLFLAAWRSRARRRDRIPVVSSSEASSWSASSASERRTAGISAVCALGPGCSRRGSALPPLAAARRFLGVLLRERVLLGQGKSDSMEAGASP